MKALSIKQPWADLIGSGAKTIETRTWSTAYRGPLLIHAGKKPADFLRLTEKTHYLKGTYCEAIHSEDRRFSGFYTLGKALFIAELWHVEPMTPAHEPAAHCSVYPGAFAWHLRNIRHIRPVQLTGQLGIFETTIKIEFL